MNSQHDTDTASQSKIIKVYGERNTNTNYLRELIELNLDIEQFPGNVPAYIKKIQKILPGKEWYRDRYFARSFYQNLGWKHTRVMAAGKLKNYHVAERNVCFISITKNPYSWLLSLHRKPYSHQFSGGKPDFETFLQMPWKTVGRDYCEKQLPNPIALWNIKNASYLQLTDLNGLNLTTESIIQDPESIIAMLSSHFSINRLSAKFVNYEKSTKDKTKDFAFYQDYYLNERWRDKLSAEAVSIINKSVDRELMRRFGYQALAG